MLLGLGATSSVLKGYFVAATVLELIVAVGIGATSFLEHSRTLRPSVLLNLYQPTWLLIYIAQTRTLWFISASYQDGVYTRVFTTVTALIAVGLILELKTKSAWLLPTTEKHSVEAFISVYSIGLVLWFCPFVVFASKNVLKQSDLPVLDTELSAQASMKYNDKIHYKSLEGVRNGLAWKLLRVTWAEFLPPLLLMILYTGLVIGQPLLVGGVVNNLSNTGVLQKSIGYGLIGGTIIIFFGMTFFRATSLYFHYRWLTRVNAILVNAIYRKALSSQSSGIDTGQAITLMSNDLENITRVMGIEFNKIVFAPVQVGVSLWLMYRQIGSAVASVLVVFGLCILGTTFSTFLVKDRQTNWMKYVDNRVGKTANAISNAKNIKISGLSQAVENSILKMREQEVQSATKFRIIIFLNVMASLFAGNMAPVFPFIFNREASIAQMFTTVAYIAMVSSPLLIFLQWVPSFFSVLASCQRIQDFLLASDRHDFRQMSSVDNLQLKSSPNHPEPEKTPPIQIVSGNFGWQDDKSILKDINTSIPSGLTLVVGPIASGKTTFCKVLLGEVPFANGQVIFNQDAKTIPYCDQSPFLTNDTIKANIVGFEPVDEQRYRAALGAAALAPDLDVLPKGDLTVVGSNGISLSGGQKQRVSIARAIYQISSVYVFDDVLSGLDSDTEQLVFDKVFGASGILNKRGATIILCTHSVRHLPSSDNIIALSSEGRIIEQGTFKDVNTTSGYIQSLGVVEMASNETAKAEHADPKKSLITESKLKQTSPEEDEVDLTRGKGDMRTTLHYLASMGYMAAVTLFLASAVIGASLTVQNLVLNWWVDDRASQSPKHSSSFWVGMYGTVMSLGYIGLAAQFSIAIIVICATAGTSLHKKAMKTLSNVPLQFLVTTDLGIIVNLFSQDLFLIDTDLGHEFADMLVFIFWSFGGAALAAIASPYVAIFYPFILAAIYALQHYYQPASRQIRLLYLESKSPL